MSSRFGLILEIKNRVPLLVMLRQIVLGPQFQNRSLFKVAFSLARGIRQDKRISGYQKNRIC